MIYFFIGILLPVVAQVSCDFLFPQEVLPENCTLLNGTAGVCRNIKDCTAALNDKSDPVKCYFLLSEFFVCCPDDLKTKTGIEIQKPKPFQNPNQIPMSTQFQTTNQHLTPIQLQKPIQSQSSMQLPASILFQTSKEFLNPNQVQTSRNFLVPNPTKTQIPIQIQASTENPENLRPAVKACRSYWRPFGPAVVKGIETGAYEFPYMVALGWEGRLPKVFDFKCGGVLIHERFVLTAAHCAWADTQQPVVVLPGGIKLSMAINNTINVKKITIHPEYVPEEAYDDIAVIELEKPIYDECACLWTEMDPQTDNLTVIGYGDTEFAGVSSEKLLKAYLAPVSNGICQHYYEDIEELPDGIIETQLCAIDAELIRDTCQGDSGGPLVNKIGSQSFVIGITSFGIGCASILPGVYTRVSEYLDWIESIVWK